MAEVLPGNGLHTALDAGVTASGTTLTIPTSEVSRWPTTGEYRIVLCADPTNGPFELVKVTGGQGTASLTVTRAAESYNGDQTARVWSAGTSASAVLTHNGLSNFLLNGVTSSSGTHTCTTAGWANAAQLFASLAVPPGSTHVLVKFAVTATTGTPNDGWEFKIIKTSDSSELLGTHMHAGTAPPVGYQESRFLAVASVTQMDFRASIWNTGSNPGTITLAWEIDWIRTQLVFRHEEFQPASSATTVTLSDTPDTVLMVSRSGIIQSVNTGHYSVDGNDLEFASAFSGSERVIVAYSTADTL